MAIIWINWRSRIAKVSAVNREPLLLGLVVGLAIWAVAVGGMAIIGLLTH